MATRSRGPDDCTTGACSVDTASASEEDVLFGWFLGAGLEYAFGPHWSAGAEYRYYHINDNLQPAGTASTPDTVSQNIDTAPIHAAHASVKFRW